tara:strand:- start:138 stop:1226 length:1089 start_codon:yes stop_codon:yes gene_type:complete
MSRNFKWGGSEQQMINLIGYLNSNNVSSTIYCYKGSDLEKYAKKYSHDHYSVQKRSSFSFKGAKDLKKAIIKLKPDLLHIHTGSFLTTVMLTDIILRISSKIIFSKKDMSDKSSLLSRLKYNYSKINYTICVSKLVKERFKTILFKKNHSKLKVIYDGIITDEIVINKNAENYINSIVPKSNIFVVGNVGNHVESKSIETLILVVDYIVNTLNIYNIHFIQIGRLTRFTPNYIEMVDESNLSSYITFTDFKENASGYIPFFNVFLITSKREGGPSSMLDALLSKVPVVTTKVGFVPELIENNKNGFISESNDYISLANDIIKLMENNDLTKKFTEINYNLVKEKFSSEVMGKETLKLYESLF